MYNFLIGLLVLLLLNTSAIAGMEGTPATKPDVARLEAIVTSPARTLIIREVADKPLAEVWQDWSTAEGQEAFFGPRVILELKTNGLYEVHFLPDAEPGQRGHEDGRILAFQENRMLAFTWTMPPYMPEIRPHHTYVQIWFDDLGNNQTAITLNHTGFGDGEKWDQGYNYFREVWPNVLAGYKNYAEEK